MFRRQFLQLAALSSAVAVGRLGFAEAAAAQSVTYLVKGFSCPTCAVGLDTILSQQKAIVSSKSNYPEGKVIVRFNPDKITESTIKAFIADMGFSVEDEHHA
jgi:hypothetical protein